MSDRDRFTATKNDKPAHGWVQGDTAGAYQAFADAFPEVDLSTESGRRKRDEFLAAYDPDAMFGATMARRVRDEIHIKNAIAQAQKENEERNRRLELKEKEDAAKFRENVKARI